MKAFSGKKFITGILTLLCILLLSFTAMAEETTEQNQPQTEADHQNINSPTGKADTANTTETGKKEIGPGIPKETEPETTAPAEPAYVKGDSLGLFTATAYCPNSERNGTQSRTYSGTIPKPQHTLSADITILPIGTKVMIDGIVYTVEDIGGSVKGKKIDIFFGSRAEALEFGRQTKELFTVVET